MKKRCYVKPHVEVAVIEVDSMLAASKVDSQGLGLDYKGNASDSGIREAQTNCCENWDLW